MVRDVRDDIESNADSPINVIEFGITNVFNEDIPENAYTGIDVIELGIVRDVRDVIL